MSLFATADHIPGLRCWPISSAIRSVTRKAVSTSTYSSKSGVSPLTRLGFALVRLRYGLSVGQVLELAPLMFGLLAEGSLLRRKRKLKQLEDAYGDVRPELRRYLADFRERCDAETRSISRRDLRDHASLFRVPSTDDSGNGEAPTIGNEGDDDFDPFSAYLFELARGLAEDHERPVRAGDWRSTERQLVVWMFREEMEKIASKSDKARWALEYGDAALFDLPGELREDLQQRGVLEEEPEQKTHRIQQRIDWLERKLSPEIEGAIRRWRAEWSDRAEGGT
ncbi:MAG: hypothetical protein OXU77_21080 [Gammaproteobacteria bacterium]|nr:hypothetical protein [Gammaproteobacteria bacterium]